MPRYILENDETKKEKEDGEIQLLANFTAKITEEKRYDDGRAKETVLTLVGRCKGKPLPPLEITASDFATMSWVLPQWGVQTVIQPGGGVRDDLRTAIQLGSAPKITTIYRHIGWTDEKQPRYLHAAGAIGPRGNDARVSVQLAPELSRYSLPDPPEGKPLTAAILSSLALTKIAPPEIAWPLWAATFAPLYGPVDYAIHLAGRTGTFKSELISLYQSHYGADMDARHLPGSWSSTGNALEAQAFFVKNAVFAVDDFIPSGTSWQQKSYQANADKLIRAQGNQAGRARLTDTSALQSTYYPRGIVVSSGEDVPAGHSIRGRMLILEIAPNQITTKQLTAAQASRENYSALTAALIQFLSRDLEKQQAQVAEEAARLRPTLASLGHTRTPTMIAHLIAVSHAVLTWAANNGVTPTSAAAAFKIAQAALTAAGATQRHYLETADPAEKFIETLRAVFETGYGHARTLNGGIPASQTRLGWTIESDGEIPQYRSHGPTIAWVDWSKDELFLEANSGVSLVLKHSQGDIGLSRQTLLKRLKEAALLTRAEDQRQRNTARVTVQGHPRTVIVLSLSTFLDSQGEIPQDAET